MKLLHGRQLLLGIALISGAAVGMAFGICRSREAALPPPRAVLLARSFLHELCADGALDTSPREIDAYLLKNKASLVTEYDRQRELWRRECVRLKDLLRANYDSEELKDLFVDDPRVAERLEWFYIEYENGDVGSVFLDAADWEHVLPRGEFGFGPENGLKSHLVEEFAAVESVSAR